MRVLRRHRELLVHLAILVLVLAALAPAVSRWLLPSWQERVLAELCSPQVRAGQALPAAPGHLLDHCPLCTLDAHHPVLPATPRGLAGLLVPRDEVPVLFLHAPRALPVWAAALSRGPPTSSLG
jgi:Protein of unknown function (DUF2946)